MNKLPNRKLTRLPGYDYSQENYYFVTICTNKRKSILGTVVGADAHIGPQVDLSPYGCIVEKWIKSISGIDKYVIMPNHVHLIIRIDTAEGPMWASAPTQSLSSRIRSFKTLVSKEIGHPLWQRSYYDHVIRNEADYLRIWQYIDENPMKWQSDEYYM